MGVAGVMVTIGLVRGAAVVGSGWVVVRGGGRLERGATGGGIA